MMNRLLLKMRLHNLTDGFHNALLGQWSGHSDWYVSSRWEWFYRFKALLCLLLMLTPRGDIPVCLHVVVTYTDGGTSYIPGEPTIHWFDALVVGHGVFSNWWATYYSDSD